MLLRSPIRWYTFRIMILTSIVWVIFGMCILVYYMECLAGNGGINCRNKINNVGGDYQSNGIGSPEQLLLVSNSDTEFLSDSSKMNSYSVDIHNNDWPHLRLPPYQESQLQLWSPAGECYFYFFLKKI